MTSVLDATRVLGAQAPRVELLPEGDDHPDADAVVEFGRACGVDLDPWQEYVLRRSLRRNGGLWAAFAVGVCAPRQNGKNAILEVRELAGPLLLGERLIVHSAHLADTSREHFLRLEQIVEANEWLSRDVGKPRRQNGHEAINFRSGARIRFRTRTGGGGRGFSGDLVVFDEAMYLGEASMSAVLPVVSARPDPQVWYTGSAVDQSIHLDGRVFARVRDRALAGEDGRLAYFEWSHDAHHPDDIDDRVAGDPETWAAANPAFGIRVFPDYIAAERSELSARSFAVERLGVGDWPALDVDASVISRALWVELEDARSRLVAPVCLAYDVSRDRSASAIAAAGRNQDGLWHVEIVDYRRGTGWVRDRLAELKRRHDPHVIVRDGYAEIPDVEAEPVNTTEHGMAFARFLDAATEKTLRHLGDPKLTAAVKGAKTRTLGDAGFAWARKVSQVDISPLVAATLALSAAMDAPEPGPVEIF